MGAKLDSRMVHQIPMTCATDDGSSGDSQGIAQGSSAISSSQLKIKRVRQGCVGALLIVALSAAFLFSVGDYRERFIPGLQEFTHWLQESGPWALILVIVTYVVACLFFVPGSLITLTASFVLGFWRGLIGVSLGSLLGATAAFWVGRTLGRHWIEHRVRNMPRFQAIDRGVAVNGFKIVFLLRLSPLFPFNLLNYALGLSKVSLRDYVLASWLGMLPGTVMYVYLGSAMKSVTELAGGSSATTLGQKILFVVGLLATALIAVVAAKIAKKALEQELNRP